MHISPMLFMDTLATRKTDFCYHKSPKHTISTPTDTVNVMLRSVLQYPAGSRAQSRHCFNCSDVR